MSYHCKSKIMIESFEQVKSQNVDNCPCNEGCPNGCPCPVYQCPSSSVLILHTYDAPNTQASVPILADLNGNVNRNRYLE